MIQICYLSNAVPEMSPNMIEDILDFSRAENRLVGVTGLLLFNGKRYLQILEGDEGEVMRLYHRIRRDRRHSHVVKVASRRIVEREFGNWDMAYQDLRSDASPADLSAKVTSLTELVSAPVRAIF